MISGLAQVMGMKPIFRSFFSRPFFSCAMACKLAIGSTLAMAAIAVRRPTPFRKARRTGSCGNSALISVASMNWRPRVSGSVAEWSCGAWSAPQPQRSISGRSAS